MTMWSQTRSTSPNMPREDSQGNPAATRHNGGRKPDPQARTVPERTAKAIPLLRATNDQAPERDLDDQEVTNRHRMARTIPERTSQTSQQQTRRYTLHQPGSREKPASRPRALSPRTREHQLKPLRWRTPRRIAPERARPTTPTGNPTTPIVSTTHRHRDA